jgi:hypothetical protein
MVLLVELSVQVELVIDMVVILVLESLFTVRNVVFKLCDFLLGYLYCICPQAGAHTSCRVVPAVSRVVQLSRSRCKR